VDILAVLVGAPDARTEAAVRVLRGYGTVELATVPDGPDKSTVDPVLSTVEGRRLVVLADLPGLNRVVLRLLRRSLLDTTPVGAVVGSPQWTRTVGLPADPAAAARVAATGTPVELGLVHDDQGGIVLHAATLRPWSGGRFGVRGYVEDAELVNDRVRELAVIPDGDALRATARRGHLRTTTTLRGRAVTVSCEGARLTVDGAELANLRRRTTWWHETARWRLIRPTLRP